jgi:hypothetical protein
VGLTKFLPLLRLSNLPGGGEPGRALESIKRANRWQARLRSATRAAEAWKQPDLLQGNLLHGTLARARTDAHSKTGYLKMEMMLVYTPTCSYGRFQ